MKDSRCLTGHSFALGLSLLILSVLVVQPDTSGDAPLSEKSQPMKSKSIQYRDEDLVSLADIAPDIRIDLAFAREDHPFGQKYYRNNVAYVRYGFARKLAEAQKRFAEKGYQLKIWEAYRPFVVQVKMFEAVGGQGDWVSDPYKSSGKKTHVRAAAVDCTLLDKDGKELAMPTPYLDFHNGSEKMKHSYQKLPLEVLANRKLLKDVMISCDLEPYSGEWWHYQDTEWAKYPVIESEEYPEMHKHLLVNELCKK